MIKCAYLALLFILLPASTHADSKNSPVDKPQLSEDSADNELEKDDVVRGIPELNFSEEERERLLQALDDYAKSADPEHAKIEEYRQAMTESIEARFLAADKDGDNTIDRLEAANSLPQIARHFSELDTNQDDVISMEELLDAQQRMQERLTAHKEQNTLCKSNPNKRGCRNTQKHIKRRATKRSPQP